MKDNDTRTAFTGVKGQISIPIVMPDALACSDVQWSVFRALLSKRISEAMESGGIAELLKTHDVRVAKDVMPIIRNEARGDRIR